MPKKSHKVHRNDTAGVQAEWKGVLFTLQPNLHHGISGSIAVKKGGKVILLTFHGQTPEKPFPLSFHEENL
jgi:hypothetical protein